MNHNYPIEQLARSVQTRFQAGFARTTMQLMPVFEDARLEATAHGLKILGANEMALTGPSEVIRKICAHEVLLEEPQVRRHYYAGQLREPIMCVRTSVDSEHAEMVIQDLVARGSTIDSVYWLRSPAVIRAQAPLRNLLGYSHVLAELSKGAANLKMWLSHYAPVVPSPGGEAA